MNVLVTAGNTLVPIDRVRCLTNVFTGRTGAGIALRCHDRGHRVTLLTSHPEAVADLREGEPLGERLAIRTYKTFDDLQQRMADLIRPGGLDAVIHTAAVSDYRCDGVFAPAEGTRFDTGTHRWQGDAMESRAAGKVKSDEQELWIRLVRTPKLIDLIRPEWGFRGVLVKFKLEVDVSEGRLLEIAAASRAHSQADALVANTLEGSREWAFLCLADGSHEKVSRRELPDRLLDAVERRHRELTDG